MPVSRALAAPLAEVATVGVEFLHTVITGISDIDIPLAVHRHALGLRELPVSRAPTAPLAEVAAAGVEFLDAVIIVSAT